MRRVVAPLALLVVASGAAAEDNVHVVQPGETLWQIALNLSGNPARWPELYRANRDQIRDPSMLYPGQRLAIPDFDDEAEHGDSGDELERAAAPLEEPE